ncbi:MAG: T9SS type A sorting domain-containing protein, partial [Bacteroidales bacterium]|nr:T9SS type A sorting domain-containing protein [Bacteroidales bacterium]
MKKNLILAILFTTCISTFAQTVTLTFSGKDESNRYVRIDSVVVENLTKGWQETLVYPDTTLTMTVPIGDGITTLDAPLKLSPNNPNPFDGTTFVNIILSELGNLGLEVMDITGRVVLSEKHQSVQPGPHLLRITLATPGVYLLRVRNNGQTAAVKMINRGNGSENAIALTDEGNFPNTAFQEKSGLKGVTDKLFNIGDEMKFLAYATIYGMEQQSGPIVQTQDASQDFLFTFVSGIPAGDGLPCSSEASVSDYDGNVYNTVQIGQQCWLKENMRTTHFSDGTAISQGSTSVSSTTAIYYNNQSLGHLYNWPATVRGGVDTLSGYVQGVCPTGWHVPSHGEWNALISYVQSQPAYYCNGDSNNIAKALASTNYWNSTTNPCA